MRPQILWILGWQVAVSVGLSVIFAVFHGTHSGLSALMGGLIGVVANAGYVWRAMKSVAGSDPVRLYRAQASGEALKFALTVLLFALVFREYREVAVLPLFLGYGSTFAIFWVALLKQR